MKKEGFGFWVIIIDDEWRIWEYPEFGFYDGRNTNHTVIMDTAEFKLANPERFARFRMTWWYRDGEIEVEDLKSFWGSSTQWLDYEYWNEECKKICRDKVKRLIESNENKEAKMGR